MEDTAPPPAAATHDAAAERTDQLTSQAVMEDLERHYYQVREERDRLQEQLKRMQEQAVATEQAQVSQVEWERKLAQQQHQADMAAEKIRSLEEENKLAKEQNDRTLAEGDSLREEISRLTETNAKLSNNAASMEAQSRVQENEAIPLFREKQRLQTELDSLQTHSNWLNQELEAKSKEYLRLKQEAHDRSLQFQLQLDRTTSDKDSAEARLEASEKMERDLQDKIQQLSRDLLASREELANAMENSQEQLREEKRIVEVQKEHLVRWEERFNDVVRQNETLKKSASQAMQMSKKELEEERSKLEAKCQALLDEQKAKYEEKLLQLPASATATVTTTARRVAADEDKEPMNFTDLYTAYEETKVALKKEEIQRKYWEIQFKQLRKEVEDSHPRMRRQAKEHELAVDKVRDYEQRLAQSIADRDAALSETKEARQEVSSLRQALGSCRVESDQLAKQVQALLGKLSGGEVDESVPVNIQQVQNQNRQLLVEKTRLEETVSGLKAQIDSDELRKSLQVKEAELAKLRQDYLDREKIFENITVQRDIYKGIIISKDAKLLGSEEEESSAVEMVQKQSARSKELEALNQELEGKLVAARAERDEAVHEKESMSERLGRYEDQALVFSATIDELERNLSTARGETARATSSAEYFEAKSKRSEDALERAQSELSHLTNARKELQKVNGELQQSLSSANTAASRVEDEKRLAESNLRLCKTQLETAKSTEARILEENAQLRSEIARQGDISDSVRKIEATLTAKSEGEKETMKENLERLSQKLTEEKAKHSSEVENLNARIQENEVRLRDFESAKQKTTSDAANSEKVLLESKIEIKSLSEKCSTLEEQLRSAKKKLGESDLSEDPEVSMQARINDLASKLEEANEELASAKEQVETYQRMSKDNEDALQQLTLSMDELRKEKETECSKLGQELDNLRKQDSLKQEMIKELTEDLSGQRDERQKIVSNLETQIAALNTEMEDKEKNCKSSSATVNALKMDVEAMRNEAALAHNNYERELKLHSQARSSLREAREKADEQASLRTSAENRADAAQRELEKQRGIWDQEKKSMREEMGLLEKTLTEAREQNKALYTQIETLGTMVEKNKTSGTDSSTSEAVTGSGSMEIANLQTTITGLREMVRFNRSENEMLQTHLDTAKRTAERERSAAAVAKRNLDEALSEIKILQTDISATGDADDLAAKLTSSKDQVKILTDSNRLLRDENESLQEKVQTLGSELDRIKVAAQPEEKHKRDLNMKIASLEAEKESLERDLQSWKDRVNSLVSKFNQIDPEEHKKLQEKVAELEEEQKSTNAWKKTTEEESTRIRNIAKTLNQKSREQKTLIEKQESDIEKLKTEKESMLKSSSLADSTAAKQRDELKGTVATMKKDAESAKRQLEGANSQNDRLRETLRKFQMTIRDLQTKEKELTSQVSTLRAKVNDQSSPRPTKEGKKQDKKANATSQDVAKQPDAEPLPTVPEGGFKFGPSDKQPPQPAATKATSPLRADASAFAPKKSTRASEGSGSTSPNKEAQAKGDTPASKKRKTASSEVTPKPTPGLSGEKDELSFKERLIEKKRKLQEAKKRKAEAEKEQQALTSDEAKPEKKAKVDNKIALGDESKSPKKGDAVSIPPPSSTQMARAGADKTVSGGSEKASLVKPSEGSEEATKSVEMAPAAVPDTETEQDEVGADVASSKSPFGIIGAAAPTTFGQSTSIAGSASASFGAAAPARGPAGSTTFGGGFLNMKPPGSSSALPTFSFGSSSSITLPTPAQPTAAAPSPFGTFASGATFGSAFGSASSPAAPSRPLFGTPSQKASEPGTTDDKTEQKKDESET